MMNYKRILQIGSLLTKKSMFLFGPRATGKSTLIRSQLKEQCVYIDLLKSSLYTELVANPAQLEPMITAQMRQHRTPVPIVIDEVQKIPILLDEVHRLIEEKKYRFLLTGSSARKLRREGANMLAGRAWRSDLFPLTSAEIPEFDLDRALRYGTLPPIWTSDSPEDELDAYVDTYLKEEIQIESRLRNLPAFVRFLKVAALQSGQLINYAQLASDAAIPETTLKSYFQIMQDTLLGFTLEPFLASKKRKAIATAKFYLFDNGVRNTLLRVEKLERHSDLFGVAFESLIGLELRAYLSYHRIKKELTFWRSLSQFEVDFLIGSDVAIEVKATERVTPKHLKGLSALAEENIFNRFIVVSQDEIEKEVTIADGQTVLLLHWRSFLDRLWRGEFIKNA